MTKVTILHPVDNGERYQLSSPTAMPKAGGFLWNHKMMIHATCRGYATAQFMQPEPAKYSHPPNIEAKTFMQPEQGYFAHHPGRFVYIRDDESGQIFSAPYEPVRAALDNFSFVAGKHDMAWTAEHLGIRVVMTLTLPSHDVAELWTVTVSNLTERARRISVYPYFVIGYMSWMNQSAEYRPDLVAVVGSSITPYQKAADYWKNKYFKDKTYFLCETQPDSWEASLTAFEGEGGLHNPSALQQAELSNSDARYETPAAVVHGGDTREFRFMFGPAYDDAEIRSMREKYLSKAGFAAATEEYAAYVAEGRGVLTMSTPDKALDNFVNHWLPRQVYYHGDVNRLATDPQTRNYLQDNMGMTWVKPAVARQAILIALGQQRDNGAMPDGIILVEGAELKYINQVPHTDHCVWVPVAVEAYLTETGDYSVLDEVVESANGDRFTVFERVGRAMDWLLSSEARDERGLSYIAQGDWCDPMNMAGIKGKGVSGWLTVATGYALKLWAEVVEQHKKGSAEAEQLVEHFRAGARDVNAVANKYLWDGEWFARGITDDNVVFGVKEDPEGRIWLNPQAWAILGAAAHEPQQQQQEPTTTNGNGVTKPTKIDKMIRSVEEQLESPHGLAMFGPPFSGMREDIGRVTQKYPGNGENASIYNHAAIFYIHALYDLAASSSSSPSSSSSKSSAQETADRAYRLLRKMLPGPDESDYLQRGQLPVYTPNYYRGAWREYPRTAGLSSQLFNTGTVSWQYRCFIEGLCGLRGCREGLTFRPLLPSHWDRVDVVRKFRGAEFEVAIRRDAGVSEVTARLAGSGEVLEGARFTAPIREGETYKIEVLVPAAV
ncbi:glycoside hydrolase family 94 protein [Microdochium trichocladiopsis]|uniref:Glycoside hydrolase family 94 protein n=1 Tax=Microdochium trichocladiopsis TaxID=1682393 RepID=A0A9P8YGQ4_9PEZI|nr:glycoside hydrolase family 94 protein [Microdochium trichocladiopsis]KAH7041402.1 glycoside hydrolase family 94 protein [Microdochium trichocladiopsis]